MVWMVAFQEVALGTYPCCKSQIMAGIQTGRPARSIPGVTCLILSQSTVIVSILASPTVVLQTLRDSDRTVISTVSAVHLPLALRDAPVAGRCNADTQQV